MFQTVNFSGNACLQQPLSGIGDAHLLRWYYDIAQDRCRNFDYTGLGGNENNFLSKNECEKICPGGYFSKKKKKKCQQGIV